MPWKRWKRSIILIEEWTLYDITNNQDRVCILFLKFLFFLKTLVFYEPQMTKTINMKNVLKLIFFKKECVFRSITKTLFFLHQYELLLKHIKYKGYIFRKQLKLYLYMIKKLIFIHLLRLLSKSNYYQLLSNTVIKDHRNRW